MKIISIIELLHNCLSFRTKRSGEPVLSPEGKSIVFEKVDYRLRGNDMKKVTSLIVFFIFLFSFFAFAQENESIESDINKTETAQSKEFVEETGLKFKFSGYFKDLFMFTSTDGYSGSPVEMPGGYKNLISNLQRIRLSPEFQISNIFLLHVDWDNELVMSSFNKSVEFNNSFKPSQYNDLLHLAWYPYEDNSVLYKTKLHRAYMKLNLSMFTFSIGRQQIRFGSGKLWNPLDILNPVSPTYMEGAEEQQGTDAVKMDVFFNEKTELTLVYDQKRMFDNINDMRYINGNSVARFKTTFSETDLAVMGGWVGRKGIAGIDTSSVFFKGILRGALLFSYPEDKNWFFQFNLGYEYNFQSGLSITGEYFYNGNGMNANTSLKSAYTQSMFTGIDQGNYYKFANQSLTFNQHYLGLAVGYEFHPLLRGDFFTIYDIQGNGLFMTLSLKYSIFENLDAVISGMFGFVFAGNSSDFQNLNNHPMVYATLQLYF
jgi:hypothetical protein